MAHRTHAKHLVLVRVARLVAALVPPADGRAAAVSRREARGAGEVPNRLARGVEGTRVVIYAINAIDNKVAEWHTGWTQKAERLGIANMVVSSKRNLDRGFESKLVSQLPLLAQLLQFPSLEVVRLHLDLVRLTVLLLLGEASLDGAQVQQLLAELGLAFLVGEDLWYHCLRELLCDTLNVGKRLCQDHLLFVLQFVLGYDRVVLLLSLACGFGRHVACVCVDHPTVRQRVVLDPLSLAENRILDPCSVTHRYCL